MPKVAWSVIEALVAPTFESGANPERADLVDLAFAAGADDDVVDALDTLSNRPLASIEALKEALQRNGVLDG